MPVETDALVASIAARQLNLITVAQLKGLGLGRDYWARRIAGGAWQRMARGVVAVSLLTDLWRQRLLAGCLSAGWPAAASHRSGAVLFGLDAIPPGHLEITVPASRDPRGTGMVVHRTTDAVALVAVDGIPCTSAARTIVDLGAVLGPQRLEQALDSAVRQRLTTVDEVAAELDALARSGRSGVCAVRRLLDQRLLGKSESRLETLFLQLVRAAGLPEPAPQVDIRAGDRLFRADFAYPQWRILIELDGAGTHSGRTALDRDLSRQNALVLDWVVLRFTWTHVVHEPEYVVRTIQAAITAARRVSA